MIRSLLSQKSPYFWTGFHVILGLLSISSRWLFVIWFFTVFFSTFSLLFKGKSQTNLLKYISLSAYLMSLELLARMANTSPLVPYEVSKYLFLILFGAGLLFSPIKSYSVGVSMTLLILPAFIYDLSNQSGSAGLIFNGLAPLGLGIGVAFMGKIKTDIDSLNLALRLIWYAVLSSLVFVVIKTPDFDSINFNLGANFETTGGESSNQVSSVLGLGMLVSFYAWLAQLKFSGNRLLDLIITVGFAFQGLLTFSRGGILVGGLAMLLMYFTFNQSSEKKTKIKKGRKSIYYLVIIAVAGFFTFQAVDRIAGGKLTLRYQGETEGTVLGRKEKNLNVITTNRFVIFLGDMELWQEHPVGGVGVGASKYLREGDSSNPHIELSRLLAEHGIPGLIYFILLVYLGFRIYGNRGSPQHRSVMLTLYFIGFATCFHSATRTFITPLLVSLSTMLPAQSGTKK